MLKALITGHMGFVGRHLFSKMVNDGYHVRGTEDVISLAQPLPDYWDVMIHLAANIVNVDDRMKMGLKAYDDILLDLNFLKWVEANPPKTLVLLSSCAVDFPDDPYCIVKRNLEAFAGCLFKRGIPVVILRPFSGYGKDQSLEYPFPAILDRAKRREYPLIVWGGEQVRDWIHIDDLTDAIIYSIDHFDRGVPIDIGTGVGTSIRTLAKMIANGVGYTPVIQGDDTKAVSSLSRIADVGLAASMGWKAKISLEEGIKLSL